MNYGFLKVAAAVPTVRVADCEYNCNQIEQLILQAETQGVEIVVFPELSITGYTCQDLFRQSQLLSSSVSFYQTHCFSLFHSNKQIHHIRHK